MDLLAEDRSGVRIGLAKHPDIRLSFGRATRLDSDLVLLLLLF